MFVLIFISKFILYLLICIYYIVIVTFCLFFNICFDHICKLFINFTQNIISEFYQIIMLFICHQWYNFFYVIVAYGCQFYHIPRVTFMKVRERYKFFLTSFLKAIPRKEFTCINQDILFCFGLVATTLVYH